jgi:Ni/Fe-hydrogenase subunit HybB-like protein
MTKLLVTACTFILSTVGWYAGAPWGIFSAFMLSIVGTGAGIYVGRQLANRWGF